MARFVRHHIQLPNCQWGHCYIVAERSDGASIGTSHASDDEDGDRKSERNRNSIPSSKVLGKEIARFTKFVGEGAAFAAYIQRCGRRRAFYDLDTGFFRTGSP